MPDQIEVREATHIEVGEATHIDVGIGGPAGISNLFIQQAAPITTELVYQWWETDGAGNLVTLWVETNGA